MQCINSEHFFYTKWYGSKGLEQWNFDELMWKQLECGVLNVQLDLWLCRCSEMGNSSYSSPKVVVSLSSDWAATSTCLFFSVCQSVADVSAAPPAPTESIFCFAPLPYFILFFFYYIFSIIFSPWRTTGVRLRWPSFLNGGKEKKEQNFPLLVGREENVEPLFWRGD